ncbi:MAG TPA: orotate phosphoribosyltransferase [Steroidobacteraceae bacterium]|jgi:orotate phosphoribosyltransferase|nr:orotate phosphoribosyltransferase [Steroidobacteraceae bacterium]
MEQFRLTFIDLALRRAALRFGRFTLKSGRESPYFFNAGLFSDGESAALVGSCYAAAISAAGVRFDMLFGPAYKGIALAAATAAALWRDHGRSVPYAFNRKEPKEHGEGGALVGAPLAGRVLIVDDVITAGTAVRASLEVIRAAGAQPAGVVLALDRQERGQGELTAVQELEQREGLKCVSVVTLDDLVEALARPPDGRMRISDEQLTALRAYRERYGPR